MVFRRSELPMLWRMPLFDNMTFILNLIGSKSIKLHLLKM